MSIVGLDATVTGNSGAIEGLQLRDFAVKDNGKSVMLSSASIEETALDLVLSFELSRFMRPKLDQIRSATEMAMAELRQGDRVAAMSFDKTARLELPLTGDLKAAKTTIRAGLGDAVFQRDSHILPAADAAARYLASQPEPHGRRVVLMFTGDFGTGYTKDNRYPTAAQVSEEMWDAQVALSGMVIPNAAARILRFDALDVAHLDDLGFNFEDYVEDVAARTGGEVVFAGALPRITATPNPNVALRQVIQRLRRRYRLYYDMPDAKPGQHRRVNIGLSQSALALHPDARVIGTKGYTIPHDPRP